MSDDYGVEDGAFSPRRPSHSPGQGGADDGDPFENGDGDVSKLAEVPAAKRKGVKRPQPKLDSQRLISDRGLPALRTLFDNVSFKGKGHEAEDLRLLMQKMENWAHRLFPKLQFEEFIDRVEKLGKKKEVQTCLKRIRLDMPLTHEDYTSKDGEEEEAPESHIFGDPDPFNGPGLPDDLPVVVHSTPAPAAPSLTEEQQRRIELNRQRALERKLARQEQQHTDLSDLQALNSSTTSDKPTSISSANIHKSKDSDEEMEDVDLKSSSQLLDKDSEPAAQSPESEEEDETGCRGENGHSHSEHT